MSVNLVNCQLAATETRERESSGGPDGEKKEENKRNDVPRGDQGERCSHRGERAN